MVGKSDVVDVPLRKDQDGVIRIGNSPVTLINLIACYQRGDTLEDIHKVFPSLSLADVYAIIAYYVANRDEVDEYIWQIETEAERLQQEYETNRPQPRKQNIVGHILH